MAKAVQRERLLELIATDPAEPGFPALAESYRRDGRPAEAERVLREGLELAGDSEIAWVVLCLTLLDLGRYDEAREVLAQRADRIHGAYFGAHPFSADLSAGELDRAFERAEPERDSLVDADRVAQTAMREAELDAPELPGPAYVTATMAELLAKQGDGAGAARIRESLAERAPQPAPHPLPRRQRRETLARWLQNLRGLA